MYMVFTILKTNKVLLWLLQKGPKSPVHCELLVFGLGPDQAGEQRPRHSQRHLQQQRHCPSGARGRGCHQTFQKGQNRNEMDEGHVTLTVNNAHSHRNHLLRSHDRCSQLGTWHYNNTNMNWNVSGHTACFTMWGSYMAYSLRFDQQIWVIWLGSLCHYLLIWPMMLN